MDKYKITDTEVKENNVKSAPTHIYGNDPAANKHLFDKLPELIVEKFNSFLDAFGSLVDEKLARHDFIIGAGDMRKAVYDADGDAMVDLAADARAFGGHKPDYYATAADLKETMPKTGGCFDGDVAAYSANRATASLRNIEVRITDTAGELQSTNRIIMVRK